MSRSPKKNRVKGLNPKAVPEPAHWVLTYEDRIAHFNALDEDARMALDKAAVEQAKERRQLASKMVDIADAAADQSRLDRLEEDVGELKQQSAAMRGGNGPQTAFEAPDIPYRGSQEPN